MDNCQPIPYSLNTNQKKMNSISFPSRMLAIFASFGLVMALFVPLWRIELDAPQYPEGLALEIHPNKIAGDVEIINGLNHYIGMKTLHTEDFIEFTLLPYFIGFFALIIGLNFTIKSKKYLLFTLVTFLLFGIVAMIDFYRWNYNYGHDLNPNAAIKVPGMAYQPPIFGFKQLLNFGAYSMPAIGGWLFISAGILLILAVLIEYKFKRNSHEISK